jgi:hypothetical protein
VDLDVPLLREAMGGFFFKVPLLYLEGLGVGLQGFDRGELINWKVE